MKKSARQIRREVDEFLRAPKPSKSKPRGRHHHATRATDAWDVAMDAILEEDPKRAAKIVHEIAHEGPLQASSAFASVMKDASSDVRARFFALLRDHPELEASLDEAPLQESPAKKVLWLREAEQRFSKGARVRIVSSDIDDYVGAKGTVIGQRRRRFGRLAARERSL